MDCTVPRSGFRSSLQWITHSLIVDSTVTRSGFCSPCHGFRSLPQWVSESQLVDSAFPRCGLHSLLQWIPEFPWLDCAVPFSELHSRSQWIGLRSPPPPPPILCGLPSLPQWILQTLINRRNSGRQILVEILYSL